MNFAFLKRPFQKSFPASLFQREESLFKALDKNLLFPRSGEWRQGYATEGWRGLEPFQKAKVPLKSLGGFEKRVHSHCCSTVSV
jgi:hypothetical protein